jgi:hypothetical protein
MALLDNGALLTTYPVSTSKFAIGDSPGSRGTPLGELEVAKKIGDSAPSGAVFKDRRRTGEILSPDAPGRDRCDANRLRGQEARNANAYGRYIYIHGTPEERYIGRPASYGCVRMRSRDVISFMHRLVGARVTIVNMNRSKRCSRQCQGPRRRGRDTINGEALAAAGACCRRQALGPNDSPLTGLPRCCCAGVRESNSTSASTMMWTSS